MYTKGPGFNPQLGPDFSGFLYSLRKLFSLEEFTMYLQDPLTSLFCVAEFGPDVYAVLKGKVVEFTMTSREVTLGRSSATARVDFDLSMEGPAFKISRRQVRNCSCLGSG